MKAWPDRHKGGSDAETKYRCEQIVRINTAQGKGGSGGNGQHSGNKDPGTSKPSSDTAKPKDPPKHKKDRRDFVALEAVRRMP